MRQKRYPEIIIGQRVRCTFKNPRSAANRFFGRKGTVLRRVATDIFTVRFGRRGEGWQENFHRSYLEPISVLEQLAEQA